MEGRGQMFKKFAVFAFPLVVLTFVAYAGIDAPAGQQADKKILRSLPPSWIPLSADFEQSAPHYKEPDKGKYYRSSDGSEREEVYQGAGIHASIKNISQSVYYIRLGNENTAWRAHPMKLPPEGWKPISTLFDSPNIERLEKRFEGMEAYRVDFHQQSGRFQIRVPDLNYLLVHRQSSEGQWVRRFNIALGEPDAAVFVPPPGARIIRSSQPAGIVYHAE
jgi:hypothetical protein